ncbi:hypothetical protein EON63_03665 [archaeon]|nr:MAG: hypothetical protein EON63_03665 [archaeon]
MLVYCCICVCVLGLGIYLTIHIGNWGEDKCRSEHKVTDKDKDLLGADIIRLVSDLNKERYHGHWGDLVHKDRHYHGAAVQAFTHHGHEDYACQGELS